ncbi:MAG: outer membrane protein assembly factor BamD, partial [Thermodesulfobacteriota bacterium]
IVSMNHAVPSLAATDMTKREKNHAIFISLLLSAMVIVGCASTSEKVKIAPPTDMIEEGMKLIEKRNYDSAIEQFRGVLDNYPLTRYAVEAQLHLADTYYEKGDYEDGAAYYTDFATLHPSHPKASYAQFGKGLCYLKNSLSIDRDPTSTKKAILAFSDLLSYYPSSIYADSSREILHFLRNRLAAREYMIGNFYFKQKNYQAALKRFLPIIKEYPGAEVTDTVLFYSGKSYIGIGDGKRAREMFTHLIDQYPYSPYTDRARRLLKNNG